MTSFCKQCSLELFDKDYEDFKDIVTIEQEKEGLVALVICEGCGHTEVNNEGECVSKDCIKTDGVKHACGN